MNIESTTTDSEIVTLDKHNLDEWFNPDGVVDDDRVESLITFFNMRVEALILETRPGTNVNIASGNEIHELPQWVEHIVERALEETHDWPISAQNTDRYEVQYYLMSAEDRAKSTYDHDKLPECEIFDTFLDAVDRVCERDVQGSYDIQIATVSDNGAYIDSVSISAKEGASE